MNVMRMLVWTGVLGAMVGKLGVNGSWDAASAFFLPPLLSTLLLRSYYSVYIVFLDNGG